MKKNFAIFILLFIGITINLNAQTWNQVGGDINGSAGEYLGWSVSLSSDGNILAIGAHESAQVRIYENQSGSWVKTGEISGSTGTRFGYSISLNSDGSIVAVGAYLYDIGGSDYEAGQVRVYENQSGTWTQIGQVLNGSDTYERLGYKVSLSSDGSVVACGSYGSDWPMHDNNKGYVRVYEYDSDLNTWSQIGSTLTGDNNQDRLGRNLSLSSDGSVVASGTQDYDSPYGNCGLVRVFENQSETWPQIGTDFTGEASSDALGSSLSLNYDGSVVAIGIPSANNENNDTDAGQVRIYENQSGTWVQIGNSIEGKAGNEKIGNSAVSLIPDGSIVAIGATCVNSNTGCTRVYKNESNGWIQIGDDINGKQEGDLFGQAVSLSADGKTVAVSASYNDDGGDNAGQVRVYTCNSYVTIDTMVCDSFTVPNVGDATYYVTGSYTDSLQNIAGCDSVVTYNFTINYSYETTIDTAVCDSFTIPVVGGTYYESGSYTASLQSITGCDSIIHYQFNIHHSEDITIVDTMVCDSFVVPNGGPVFYDDDASPYKDTLESAAGCDSIVEYNFVIGNDYTGTEVVTECDSYTWGDSTYYESTITTHTFESVTHCDSVVTLDLTVLYSSTKTDVISACGSYTWIDGNTYTESNSTATYTFEGQNVFGCDSVVTLGLTIHDNSTGIDVISACGSYTWIDGNTYTSSNNTATHTLQNVHGCDSIVTLGLTINTVDVSVTENGLTLTANANEANYQWINCGNDNIPIDGEASQNFTATENGSYAVIVDNGLCVDTSICYTVTVTGINRIENNSIDIYPNPTNGIIEIGLVENNILKISIVDMSGKEILEKIPEAQNEKIDLSGFSNGLYIIMVETDKKIYISKIVKE